MRSSGTRIRAAGAGVFVARGCGVTNSCFICHTPIEPTHASHNRRGVLCWPCDQACGEFVISLMQLNYRDREALAVRFEVVGQHWAARHVWPEAPLPFDATPQPATPRQMEDEIARLGLSERYIYALERILGSRDPWEFIRATPEQRARAFLEATRNEVV
jgi:hypothetical protein